MQFKASVTVMPQKEILDPQGKAVEGALHQLSDSHIENVRIGKRIEFTIESDSKENAETEIDQISRKLLANLIMEDYSVEIQPV